MLSIIYDTDGVERIRLEGINYLDLRFLINAEWEHGGVFTAGKITDENGNESSIAAYEQSFRTTRDEVFSRTLDRMNPIWYDTLLPVQQEQLKAWRLLWLDYPDTKVMPEDLEGIFSWR